MEERTERPAPISYAGWLSAFFLSACLFWVYYSLLYGLISGQYQKVFWSSFSISTTEKEKISIRVHVPKYIADFVDREIRIESWNKSAIPKELHLTVQAEMYDDKWAEKLKRDDCKPIELRQPFVYISTESSFYQKENNSIGQSTVSLNLPSYGSSSANLWIIMQPGTQTEDGRCVVLRFYEIHPPLTDLDNRHQNCEQSEEGLVCPLSRENSGEGGVFVVRLDRQKTFAHSLINNLLLPPWSNILFPAVAFLTVGFAEHAIKLWKENKDKKKAICASLKTFSLIFGVSSVIVIIVMVMLYVMMCFS